MTRLQRYIFGQTAVAAGLGVGLFMFVFVAVNVLREVLPELANGRLEWGEFFEATALQLPSALPFTMPVGVLAGVLIVLGRMSAQSEIVAMKAAGMSLWRIVAPIFFLASLGVAASIFINFEFAPYANDRFKEMLFEKISSANPADLILPGEFTRFKKSGKVVFVGEREGKMLKDVWIWDVNAAGEAEKVRHCETATIAFSARPAEAGGDVIQIQSNNFTLPGDPDALFESDMRDPAVLRKFLANKSAGVSAGKVPVEIPVDVLRGGIGDRSKKLRYYDFEGLMKLRETGYDLKIPKDATPAQIAELRFANRIAVQLQIQNNLVNAFGILSMTMVAIPLGIRTGRSETIINLLIALMLMLVFYFLTVAMTWIKNPFLRPDILVWLPNLIFQGIGFWLLKKAAKT